MSRGELNRQHLLDFFNYDIPSPGEIKKGRQRDLSKYKKLTLENILDEIINCKPGEYVNLSEETNRIIYGSFSKKPKPYISYWREAPDVMLNTTEMTVEQSKSFRLNEAIAKAEWDYKKPHRGYGVIDPRTHIEIVWPFLYLIEGYKLAELGYNIIEIKTSTGIDITGSVPSVSKKEKDHEVTLKNVSTYLSTLIQLYVICTCSWPKYGPRRQVKRYESGEMWMCRHGIALYEKVQRTYGYPDIIPVPDQQISDLFFKLKQNVTIGGKKPNKTQMNILIGALTGYLKNKGQLS